MEKNIPINPNNDPKTNTEYNIAKGCNPSFSPIIFGDRIYPSNKQASEKIIII